MITQIRAKLAQIQSSINGIKRVYEYAPMSLAPSDLPAFVTFIGTVIPRFIGEQLIEETRSFLMRLYVIPIQSGIDGEAEKAVEPFMGSVRDAFLSHPALYNLEFVRQVNWLGDGGIQILSYAGENYIGVEFKISIVQFAPIIIAAME
ncbi:hypothetical protein C4588_04190 [Candidatus Parcubacteria bacterium]|nr:MAG: hypothetical protein C4588_04190 [Candidatus Parcubacteria bacterium]